MIGFGAKRWHSPLLQSLHGGLSSRETQWISDREECVTTEQASQSSALQPCRILEDRASVTALENSRSRNPGLPYEARQS